MSGYLKTNKVKVNGITYELEDSKTKEALENEILRARKAESDLEELQKTYNNRTENILWDSLVTKLNKKELAPGQKYRIIDYVATTVQANTVSANNRFDIIVEALSNSQLSETAKACIHEGDSYFEGNNLDSWEIKYCLDNDTSRFGWADTVNGKGVIYWMKDESNNEAWYDFKGIMFLRTASWFSENPGFNSNGPITNNTYFYTFSSIENGVVKDDSLSSTTMYHATDNHLGRDTSKVTKLNNTIFIDKPNNKVFNNIIADGHKDNTFGQSIWSNVIDHDFKNNIINKNFAYNKISSKFEKNHVLDNFLYNIVDSYCSDNRFNGKVDSCTIGSGYCLNNFIGDLLYSCNFGSNIKYISDLPSISNVTFLNNCINSDNSINLNDLVVVPTGDTLLHTIENLNNELNYVIYKLSNNQFGVYSYGEEYINPKENILKVSYYELVNLRDSGQLIPGMKYHIIDYSTKTSASNTQSMLWNFDIIVEAKTENTLSEKAQVCRCFDTRRDHGDENNSDLYNWSDVNNWKAYGSSDGGPTLPDDILEMVGDFAISTELGTRQITANSKIRITLQGITSSGASIKGFGAALIKNGEIIDSDFGFRSEFYLKLPSGYTSGDYAMRFYAVGEISELINGVCGARAESFNELSHFNNSNLDAWEIKYCLDNDISRFSWADTENGRGVIYYMKDEYGNEAPYDFKNIQFNTSDKYHYTFSYDINNVSLDGSVDSRIQSCNKNIILSKYQNNTQILNNNIFINTELNSPCINNKILNGYNIVLPNSCCNVVIKGDIRDVKEDLVDITPNSDYEIVVSKNSAGDIKIYCEADLIQ